MKKGLVLSLLGVVLFAGCTGGGELTEKDRFKNAVVEVTCDVIKPLSEMSSADDADMEAVMEEMAAMEGKMEEIVKKHGFESMEAFEKLGEEIGQDEVLEQAAKDAVKARCDFDVDAEGMDM